MTVFSLTNHPEAPALYKDCFCYHEPSLGITAEPLINITLLLSRGCLFLLNLSGTERVSGGRTQLSCTGNTDAPDVLNDPIPPCSGVDSARGSACFRKGSC